jgi:hypothetical protein
MAGTARARNWLNWYARPLSSIVRARSSRQADSTWWTLISWLSRTWSFTLWDSFRLRRPYSAELALDRRATGRSRKNMTLTPTTIVAAATASTSRAEMIRARRLNAIDNVPETVETDEAIWLAWPPTTSWKWPSRSSAWRGQGACSNATTRSLRSRVRVWRLMRLFSRASRSWTTRRARPRPVAIRNRARSVNVCWPSGPRPTSTLSLSDEMAKATWTMTMSTPASRKPASTPWPASRARSRGLAPASGPRRVQAAR